MTAPGLPKLLVAACETKGIARRGFRLNSKQPPSSENPAPRGTLFPADDNREEKKLGQTPFLAAMKKPFTTIAVGIFALVALVHVLRLVLGWEVTFQGGVVL